MVNRRLPDDNPSVTEEFDSQTALMDLQSDDVDLICLDISNDTIESQRNSSFSRNEDTMSIDDLMIS